MIRHLYVAAFAALAALGMAAVARPACLWVGSLGLWGIGVARDVPAGAMFLGAAALLALHTLCLAFRTALRRRGGISFHAGFLISVGICLALREGAGDPLPPPDPGGGLFQALRAAASELDRGYAGDYVPDAAGLASSLPPIALPFRRLGHSLPLRARVLTDAAGPQLEALAGDRPGTLYVALCADRQRAWLTALSLDGILRLPSGRPAVVEAVGGTHSLPGRDPATPVYPRARSAR